MSTIDQPLEVARQVADEYRACYGDGLQSVTAYGSAATGDFDPKRSDINLLVVLQQVTLAAVEQSQVVQEKWLKKRVARPLFMDREYMARSLDVFPIEFLNMQQAYVVLAGDDVLADLSISRQDLRLQAERELKGKWLHLLRDWPAVRSRRRRLQHLLALSLGDFTAVFRALLHLRGVSVPAERRALWQAVVEQYELPDNPFERAQEAVAKGDATRMVGVFPAYVSAIETLIAKVDQLPREEQP